MQIKLFTKEKRFAKENLHQDISLYWNIAVCLMIFSALCAFSYGYYVYRQVNHDEVVSIERTNTEVDTVKKDRIDNAITNFSARKDKSAQIQNSPALIVDPSL